MNTSSQPHLFSLFVPYLSNNITDNTLIYKNQELSHRLLTVLRMRSGEQIILFDQTYIYRIELTQQMFSAKKLVSGTILQRCPVVPLVPSITLAIGLLKKSSLETVAFYAGQMGATRLALLYTEKVQRIWAGHKEYDRLTKSIISGCEQAKSFSLPVLEQPLKFDQFVSQDSSPIRLYAEPGGQRLIDVMKYIAGELNKDISIVIGPEGGLTDGEIKTLDAAGYTRLALTPTILRSVEAASLTLGALRSLTSEMSSRT